MAKNIKKFNVKEYLSWLMSKASPHNCVLTAAIQGKINTHHLGKIIMALIKKQKLLKYSIDPTKQYFIKIKKPLAIQIINNKPWKNIVERELKNSFNTGDILIRIIYLKNINKQYLIVTCHHIISDGISLISFSIIFYFHTILV